VNYRQVQLEKVRLATELNNEKQKTDLFFIQHGCKRKKLNDRHHHANKKTRGNAHGSKLTPGDIVVDRNVNQKIGDRSTDDDDDDDDDDIPKPIRSKRNRRQ